MDQSCIDAFGYGDPEKAFTRESIEACFLWLPTSCIAKIIGWSVFGAGVGSLDPIALLLRVAKSGPIKGGLFALMQSMGWISVPGIGQGMAMI